MANNILSEDNKFQFKCPVFEAPTKFSACVKLRDLVWRGERPEKRQGCQVAMRCGTCPVAKMVQYKAFQSDNSEYCYSSEPVMGRLKKDILTRIQPVLNTQSVMQLYNLSPGEIKLLSTSIARIADMIGKAPDTAPVRKSKKAAPKKSTPKISNAATTGDLAAAINE